MKQNLTFEDLEGALMLISYDTVDEDGVVERETLAYTYADGKLKFYTFDAEGIALDASFDPADHEILKVTTYDFDPEDYEDATDLVKAILKHEGREIIKEAPYNEWEIVDNKVNIVVYNAERECVAEHSWKSRAKKKEVAPKEPEMTKEEEIEAFQRSWRAKMEADERTFRYDRRRLGLYILLLLATSSLVGWLCWRDGFTRFGIWFAAILSGLYLTQIVWCNFGGAPLGVARVGPTRRAKGRPWINGGFIIAIVTALLNGFLNEPRMNIASCIFLGVIIGIVATLCWWVCSIAFAKASPLELLAPGWLNSMKKSYRKIERRELRDFYAEVFKRMFWLD